MDEPIEDDYEQELAETWDDIDGQDFEPEVVRKARALEMEWYRKTNVFEETHRRVLREDQETVHQGEVDRPQQMRQIKHERDVEAGGKADQYTQGTRFVRGNAATRGFADAAISDGHWEQAQGVDVQRHRPSVHMHARTTRGQDRSKQKLILSMYGTRAAAHDWQSEVTRTMIDLGVKQGQSISMRILVPAKKYQSACSRRRVRVIP